MAETGRRKCGYDGNRCRKDRCFHNPTSFDDQDEPGVVKVREKLIEPGFAIFVPLLIGFLLPRGALLCGG